MAPPNAPAIQPVAPGSSQPLWSVVIPTYNCAHYLRVCLQSVLDQGVGPDVMEIVVVDDASSDNPQAVVEELAAGRVRFVAQDSNVGAIANFNRCLAESSGQLVHLLHGDDLVRPGFYQRFTTVMHENTQVGLAMCRTHYVDAQGATELTTRSEQEVSGVWSYALGVLAISNRIRPPGVVVRRRLYEDLGGFRTDLPHAADWEMWTRLAAASPVWFENQALAAYRRHVEQDTSHRVQSGENITERIDAILMISELVPPGQRAAKRRAAMGYSALFAANTAMQQARKGSWSAAVAQLKGTARCAWLAARG